MIRRASVAALALTAVAALALTACGGSKSSAPAAPKSNARALAAVGAAARKTADAGAFRVAGKVKLSVSGLSGSLSVKMNGAIDVPANRGALAVDLGGDGVKEVFGASSAELRFDGPVYFLKHDAIAQRVGKGKAWIKLDLARTLAAMGETFPADSPTALGFTPQETLREIRLYGTYAEAGKDEIRDVKTTRYEGTVDWSKAAIESYETMLADPDLDAEQKKAIRELKATIARLDVKPLPIELWIGDDGLLRKLKIDAKGLTELKLDGGIPKTEADTAALRATVQFSRARLRAELEFFDFGALDLDTAPPPRAETQDLTDLAAKLASDEASKPATPSTKENPGS